MVTGETTGSPTDSLTAALLLAVRCQEHAHGPGHAWASSTSPSPAARHEVCSLSNQPHAAALRSVPDGSKISPSPVPKFALDHESAAVQLSSGACPKSQPAVPAVSHRSAVQGSCSLDLLAAGFPESESPAMSCSNDDANHATDTGSSRHTWQKTPCPAGSSTLELDVRYAHMHEQHAEAKSDSSPDEALWPTAQRRATASRRLCLDSDSSPEHSHSRRPMPCKNAAKIQQQQHEQPTAFDIASPMEHGLGAAQDSAVLQLEAKARPQGQTVQESWAASANQHQSPASCSSPSSASFEGTPRDLSRDEQPAHQSKMESIMFCPPAQWCSSSRAASGESSGEAIIDSPDEMFHTCRKHPWTASRPSLTTSDSSPQTRIRNTMESFSESTGHSMLSASQQATLDGAVSPAQNDRYVLRAGIEHGQDLSSPDDSSDEILQAQRTRPRTTSRQICLDSDSSPEPQPRPSSNVPMGSQAHPPSVSASNLTSRHHMGTGSLDDAHHVRSWPMDAQTASRKLCLHSDSSPEPASAGRTDVASCINEANGLHVQPLATTHAIPFTRDRHSPTANPQCRALGGSHLSSPEQNVQASQTGPSTASRRLSIGSDGNPKEQQSNVNDMYSSPDDSWQPHRQRALTGSRQLSLQADSSPEEMRSCRPGTICLSSADSSQRGQEPATMQTQHAAARTYANAEPDTIFSSTADSSRRAQEPATMPTQHAAAHADQNTKPDIESRPDEFMQASQGRALTASRRLCLESDSSPETLHSARDNPASRQPQNAYHFSMSSCASSPEQCSPVRPGCPGTSHPDIIDLDHDDCSPGLKPQEWREGSDKGQWGKKGPQQVPLAARSSLNAGTSPAPAAQEPSKLPVHSATAKPWLNSSEGSVGRSFKPALEALQDNLHAPWKRPSANDFPEDDFPENENDILGLSVPITPQRRPGQSPTRLFTGKMRPQLGASMPGTPFTPRARPPKTPAGKAKAQQECVAVPSTPFTPMARPPKMPARGLQPSGPASRTVAKQLAAFRKERESIARTLFAR